MAPAPEKADNLPEAAVPRRLPLRVREEADGFAILINPLAGSWMCVSRGTREIIDLCDGRRDAAAVAAPRRIPPWCAGMSTASCSRRRPAGSSAWRRGRTMNRVLLLAAPVHHSGDMISMRLMPPPAIYVLAAVLRQNGFAVRVLDPTALRRVQPLDRPEAGLDSLLADALDGVDAVGISANSINWGVARLVAAEIRRQRPGMPIICGGVHPTYFDRHVVAHSAVDYVIRGEGEEALPQLLRCLAGEPGGVTGRSSATPTGPGRIAV